MDERFRKLIKVVLKNECGNGNGYVNDKDDAGGVTVYGITRRNHPDLIIWKSLDDISTVREKKRYKPSKEEMDEVYDTYYILYYRRPNIERIEDDELCLQVFDMGVNAGTSRAIRMLQETLSIRVDGICGEQTITTANLKRNVTEAYKEKRREYYKSIARKGNNRKFLKGWLNRVDNTRLA